MRENLRIKKIYSLLYIIFIGAIGSGLWEIFLKDFIYYLGAIFVRMASSIYDGYFDRLYESVGRQTDLIASAPGILLFVFVIFSPIFAYLYISQKLTIFNYIKNDRVHDSDEELTKLDYFVLNQLLHHQFRLKLVLIAPIVFTSILTLDLAIVSISSYRAVKSIQMRLEIIRPYLSDADHYKLISDFRLINNRQKLQVIVNKIDAVANENSIDMPRFRLYGIESKG